MRDNMPKNWRISRRKSPEIAVFFLTFTLYLSIFVGVCVHLLQLSRLLLPNPNYYLVADVEGVVVLRCDSRLASLSSATGMSMCGIQAVLLLLLLLTYHLRSVFTLNDPRGPLTDREIHVSCSIRIVALVVITNPV